VPIGGTKKSRDCATNVERSLPCWCESDAHWCRESRSCAKSVLSS